MKQVLPGSDLCGSLVHVSTITSAFCACTSLFCNFQRFFFLFYKFLAGAVDEDVFQKAFDDVPTVQIYSQKELSEQMKNISEIISDPSKDWNKRTEAVTTTCFCFYYFLMAFFCS